MTTYVDVFPISLDLQKYKLSAFYLEANNLVEIGATFAAQVRGRRGLPCAWVRDEKIIVTPASLSHDDVLAVLQELWDSQTPGFELVTNIYPIPDWQPSPSAIANFVVMGVLDQAKSSIKNELKNDKLTIKTISVERAAETKAIVVNGEPALQITVRSPFTTTKKLSAFYDANDPDKSIKNRPVKCKDTRGIAEKKIGELGQMRKVLKGYKPTDYDPAILDRLPDNHPVIEVKPYFGKKRYHYPLEVLEMTVDMGSLGSLGLTSPEITRITYRQKIAPDKRFELVSAVKASLANFLSNKYPAITLGDRYNSDTHTDYFATAEDIGFDTGLRFGRNIANISKDTEMLKAIRANGLFKKADKFQQDNTFRIAVVDVILETPDNPHAPKRNDQLKRFVTFLNSQGLTVKRAADPVNIQETNSMAQRAQLTSALKKLVKDAPDIILIYLPDSENNKNDEDELSLYNTAKSVCIDAEIPSQVIMEKNIGDTWSDDNILMGILGKTGNIPYILAKPLNYANLIVGLDVSRQIKTNSPGTTNTAAMSRIHTNTGEIMGYAASGMSVQGEIIPLSVLERILPEDEFANQSSIVHRDGRFVGDEIENILEWGGQIGAEFLPIEIAKSGVARFYKLDNDSITQADKGTIFILSDTTAYLVSSLPPQGKSGYFSTARPLEINNYSRLSLQEALHSVLALTLLHYGSVRSTRLPVSTHASDKIAGFLSKLGISFTKGNVPFWL